jgi:flagellar biosynthesis protein FlhA
MFQVNPTKTSNKQNKLKDIMPGKELKNINQGNTPLFSQSSTILVIGLVTILATLLIPLPTFMLDILLACSISLSIAVLIITLSSKEALELSSFPSLLLFVTLFRLSLNVASTRLILLQADAGKIIHTFGSLVAGNSFLVGMVIFLILVIIQFIVITKGAERISEVSARFTLDAMPGKQMAIDADLNAGAITETQANHRRKKIIKESEFYGAMDGASKFIRGDAKAGLIITAVNIIGGIGVGYIDGMTVIEAVKTYSILSIGDGLISQIPSLVISLSSGFLVTKISSENDVSQDLSSQFLKAGRPLIITSGVIASLAIVPGLPITPFLGLGALVFFTGRSALKYEQKDKEKSQKSTEKQKPEKKPVEEMLDIDRVSVNVGVRLVSMVDPRKNSSVFDRIGALRRRFAKQLGVIIPLVRLKDNMNIEPNSYEIRFSDITVARGKLEPDMLLAMDSGTVRDKIDGIQTTEPVYGLPALWISEDKKDQAEINGYTVIDSESVFITHLSETIKKHCDELLTREDVQVLIERLRKTQPSLVTDVIGELVPMGLLQRVLKNLLKDGIPVRELTAIIECLGECAVKTKNPETLTEMVRKALGRNITEQFKQPGNKIKAITLEPSLEHYLTTNLVQQNDALKLSVPAEVIMDISRKTAQAWKNIMNQGIENAVLVCDASLRKSLSDILQRAIPMLSVLAYDEVVSGVEIEPIATITSRQDFQTPQNTEQQETAEAIA